MSDIEIRDNPDVKSILRKISEAGITGIIWVMWAYIFLPIINVLFWIFGVRSFYVEVIEKVGYMELLNLINKMGWFVLVVFLILRLWGYYNYLRFGKKNRRRNAMPFDIGEMAKHFGIPVEEITRLQSKKEIVWHYADE